MTHYLAPVQLIAALGGGGALGAVLVKIIEQLGKRLEMSAANRRSETDRADAAERRARVVEESLAIHRRIIIDAPCLGPGDLPAYPSRKDTP